MSTTQDQPGCLESMYWMLYFNISRLEILHLSNRDAKVQFTFQETHSAPFRVWKDIGIQSFMTSYAETLGCSAYSRRRFDPGNLNLWLLH